METTKKKGYQGILKELRTSGTLNDKVSALLILVKDSFVTGKYCDFERLDELMGLAKKKSRYQSNIAVEGLSELFTDNLVHFSKSKTHSKVDEALKSRYLEFIDILKSLTHDTVEHSKKTGLRMLSELVVRTKEEVDYIFDCIVNKLGDSVIAIPTVVVLECNKIARQRRELRESLVSAVSRFAFRKNLSKAGLFYSIVLLSSLKVRSGENELISSLLRIYIKLFPVLLKTNSKEGNKAISLLLKGINKLYPLYSDKASLNTDFFNTETAQLYKLTHFKANPTIQLQTLRFIYYAEKSSGLLTDRFYQTLYEFILPVPFLSSLSYESLTLLINTLFLSLKDDHNITRVKSFIKRILQCCLILEPATILAFLLATSELMQQVPSLRLMVSEKPLEDTEENYQDAPDSEDETPPEPRPQEGTCRAYDPLKRQPQFSNSEYTGLFELKVLSQHPHPTVQNWAQLLLDDTRIAYESDPLLDYSLINFLDRISFRNPKAQAAHKVMRRSLVEPSVNSAESTEFREEEVFFKKYFALQREGRTEEYEESSDEDLEEFEDSPVKKKKSSVFADASSYPNL